MNSLMKYFFFFKKTVTSRRFKLTCIVKKKKLYFPLFSYAIQSCDIRKNIILTEYGINYFNRITYQTYDNVDNTHIYNDLGIDCFIRKHRVEDIMHSTSDLNRSQ